MADCPLAASGPWVCNSGGRYVVIRRSRFDHDRVSDGALGGYGMSHRLVPLNPIATCVTLIVIHAGWRDDDAGVVGGE